MSVLSGTGKWDVARGKGAIPMKMLFTGDDEYGISHFIVGEDFNLSSSIVEAASTTPDLHDLPTSTTTTSNPTAVPTGSGSGSNTDSDTTFPSNRSTFPSETGQGDVPLSGGGAGGAGGTGSIIGPSVFVALVGATFVLMILL
ncbi:hypothetical protein EYZ11_006994 [Aspergillus tanneri]|uniref:Uncharacterized protein n=1 Tax=Aspergillus tanneri TaxID=1220188 RepID=A0A4V3UP38_9EURO|nr:hypothetical protein EYZ11_006994 [Aspergillus tanneri]